MMLGDKLIEGAVNSYNTIAKKLIDSLVNKETDNTEKRWGINLELDNFYL